jgi:GNAT superfamily N-acetyltransferase
MVVGEHEGEWALGLVDVLEVVEQYRAVIFGAGGVPVIGRGAEQLVEFVEAGVVRDRAGDDAVVGGEDSWQLGQCDVQVGDLGTSIQAAISSPTHRLGTAGAAYHPGVRRGRVVGRERPSWPWDEERTTADRAFDAFDVRIFEVAHRRVGFLVVEHGADADVLDEVVLIPQVRGQGVGTLLIEMLASEATARGVLNAPLSGRSCLESF